MNLRPTALLVYVVCALAAAGSAPGGLPLASRTSSGPAPAEQPPAYLGTWGSYCNTSIEGVDGCDGDFFAVHDVAVNAAGQVYVADRGNDRIQRFDSEGTYQIKWGVNGSGNGQFNRPEGLAINSKGDVFVVDSANSRIQKFDADGNFIFKWGSYGSGDYEFRTPIAVTVDPADNVYVSDWSNSRVVKYTKIGVFMLEWGAFCDTNVSGVDGCDGDFAGPYGLAVDSSYNVYVAESFNNRVQKFSPNGASLLAKWGEFCDISVSGVDGCDGDFYYPLGVAVDADDNVYVTDNNNHRVQKFDSSGNLLARWGVYGNDPGQLRYPAGLFVDASGIIFIADRGGSRVRKFGPPPLEFFIGPPEPLATVTDSLPSVGGH